MRTYKDYTADRMKGESVPANYLIWTKFSFLEANIYIRDNSLLKGVEKDIIDSLDDKKILTKKEFEALAGEPVNGDICICTCDAESREIIDTANFNLQ